jgi:hypothetical protein
MTPREKNIVVQPDPLPTNLSGIILSTTEPNYRTGTILSVGPDVKWYLPKEGRRICYRQRNCISVDGVHIIDTDAIESRVAEDVCFAYEEKTPDNKIKIHLKKYEAA